MQKNNDKSEQSLSFWISFIRMRYNDQKWTYDFFLDAPDLGSRSTMCTMFDSSTATLMEQTIGGGVSFFWLTLFQVDFTLKY